MTPKEGFFNIIIELSLQGLLRKYAEALRTQPGLTFRAFIKAAIKASIENQFYRRITNENYESLQFEESDRSKIREQLEKYDLNGDNENFPIQMHWEATQSGVFNMISYPINTWLENLNSRNRDLRERSLIKTFQ